MSWRGLIGVGALFIAMGAMAAPAGEWHCVANVEGTRIERTLQFVGGKLIHKDGLGRKSVVSDAAISDEYVFWNNGPDQEFEFFPERAEMIEKARVLGSITTIRYACAHDQ